MAYGVGKDCGCEHPVAPVVAGAFTSTGTILVLFILLVIICRTFWV